jgi:DNA-binding response OmpR family regulator
MFKILLSGNDFRLLATRAAVLEKTGASVVACCDASEALYVLEQEKISLVVLCHSLRDDEANTIAEKVREHNYQTKTLMLVLDRYRDGLNGGGKFDATSLPDPEEFGCMGVRADAVC